MNTEITDMECTKVDNLHDESSQNETSSIQDTTEDNNGNNSLNCNTFTESQGDKSMETGDPLGMEIDGKGGTLENKKDKCNLKSNSNPKHLEDTECDKAIIKGDKSMETAVSLEMEIDDKGGTSENKKDKCNLKSNSNPKDLEDTECDKAITKGDKGMETGDPLGMEIDDKGGTSENKKDKCNLKENSNPKNLEDTESDKAITKGDKSMETGNDLGMEIDDKGETLESKKDKCKLNSISEPKKSEDTECDKAITKVDKSMETGNASGMEIDNEGGTLESNKDKCILNSNTDPKNFEDIEGEKAFTKGNKIMKTGNPLGIEIDDTGGILKRKKDKFNLNSDSDSDPKKIEDSLNGNGEQGIDLEDENISNVEKLTDSTINTEDRLLLSKSIKDNSLDSDSRTSLVDDDNCNDKDKSNEYEKVNTQVNEETGIELLSSPPVKSKESLDKDVSNNNEQLSTNTEIFHSSANTNVTDSQDNNLPADENSSEQENNTETIEENSENLTEDPEDCGFNIAMVVVQEKTCKTEKKPEKMEVLLDLPTQDQQQEQQQQQQLPEGWKRETVQRSRKNRMDIYYVSPTGLRLRSEAEVYQYCEQEGLQLDLSLFDFGYEEVELTDSDTTVTISEDDSDDDQVVWASTGNFVNNKKSKERLAKANAPFDIVNSQISKSIYLGDAIVLTPKVIPYKVTVNAKIQLPEFLKDYTVLRHDDYLAFRTKEQFWQEPFMKRIYEALDDREISIAMASELVGVRSQKLHQEYQEFTRNPWLTDAFSKYLGNKDGVVAANSIEASTSQQLKPIRSAGPSQIIPSTSRLGAFDIRMKKCSCKKSECLKTSCVCYNNFEMCQDCGCKDCHNKDKDPKREEALKNRLTKMYPLLSKDLKVSNTAAMAAYAAVQEMMTAGKPTKGTSLNNGAAASAEVSAGRKKKAFQLGCSCSKTGCCNKTCGCYSKGLNCSDACQCAKCNNRISMHSLFSTMNPAQNFPLNSAPPNPPGFIVESITDSIRRLFPQIVPEPTIMSNTQPNNESGGGTSIVTSAGNNFVSIESNVLNTRPIFVSRGETSIVTSAGTNFVTSDMPIARTNIVASDMATSVHNVVPIVVSRATSSARNSPLPTTLTSSVIGAVPASQPRSSNPTLNAIKGLEDKDTFLHKWVEANYMIDASNFWEENLIFLHLKNTIERLGLKHVVSLYQLREAVRKVFGPGVGPNKSLGTSYWLYTGIKPVLAHPASTTTAPSTSSSLAPPTTQLTDPSAVTNIAVLPTNCHRGSTTVSAAENDDDVCIVERGNDTTPGAHMVTIPSSIMSEGRTAEVSRTSGSNQGSPMVTIHSVESLAASSSDTINKQTPPNITLPQKRSNKEDCIIGWLRENYKKTGGSVDIDSLYQKCLSNLTTTHQVFSISEFISCVKYVFGAEVGPKPCYDAKDVLRWHFVGIWPKDSSIISTDNSRSGSTTDTALESDDDVCIIDGDNDDGGDDTDDMADQEFNPVISEVVGGGGHSMLHLDSQEEGNSNRNDQAFCPVIEDVYTQHQASQTSVSGSKTTQGGYPPPPRLTGPHGMSSGPVRVGPTVDGLSGNANPSGAMQITNPAGPTVARAVEVGIRVQRGPDWIHGDEDGHGLGTVTELSKNGTVQVIWDCKKSAPGVWYNMGLNGKYRLRPADDAPRIAAPEFMPSMLARPPPPLLINPSAPSLGNSSSTALGSLPAPTLGNPSVPIFGNPYGPILGIPQGHIPRLPHGTIPGIHHGPIPGIHHGPIPGIPHGPMARIPVGPMLGIPPGLMLTNPHGPMLGPMLVNTSVPMSVNPTVATKFGNSSAPSPANQPFQALVSPPQEITISEAADVAVQMPIWTHHRVQMGTIVKPGPNWHHGEDSTLGKGLVLELKVIGSRQYARVKWSDKDQYKWGWYCYSTGEIQLAEGVISVNMAGNRRLITHPSGLSRRERRTFSKITNPRIVNIDTEEVLLEWILTNCQECPGSQYDQVDIYQKCKKYMDSRSMKAGGPIVLGNILRKIFGNQVGPKRTQLDGELKWRYQGISGISKDPLSIAISADDGLPGLQERGNEVSHELDKRNRRTAAKESMCQEETEKMITNSERTYSPAFEGHNFSPQKTKQSDNHSDQFGTTSYLRNSRSPSPMSRSPSPLSTLSPASSLDQLSDIDSHDGTNLDLEDSLFDASSCISDTDFCDIETDSPTKQKELPNTHLKYPDCPYDPIKDRKMWLLYIDTFGK